jgi:hypothetical protein
MKTEYAPNSNSGGNLSLKPKPIDPPNLKTLQQIPQGERD